jgi:hypothetical protein
MCPRPLVHVPRHSRVVLGDLYILLVARSCSILFREIPFLALVISATMTAMVLGSLPSAANSVLLRLLRQRCRDRAEDWILVSFAVRIAPGHCRDHLRGQVQPKGALRSIPIACEAQLAREMALLYPGLRGRQVHDQVKQRRAQQEVLLRSLGSPRGRSDLPQECSPQGPRRCPAEPVPPRREPDIHPIRWRSRFGWNAQIGVDIIRFHIF